MNIINTLSVGDSANWHDDPWTDPLSRLQLTSADWALSYQLRGPSQLALTAVADGDGWRTSIGTAASALLQAGLYLWSAYLSKTGERVTIGKGSLTLVADLAAIAGPLEARSEAVIALAACKAALVGKVLSYTIGSRQTTYRSMTELLAARDYWQRIVNKEKAQEALANGHTNPRRLLVRF